MTPIFLEKWRAYKESLSVFVQSSSEEEKRSADEFQEELQELFQQMNQAAEDMDIDALDQIWSQLEEYQFREEQQEFLEQIHKAIMEFDVDFLQKATWNDLDH